MIREKTHEQTSKFPAHLSTINVAMRDLSVKQNYPNVVYDFFNAVGLRASVRMGCRTPFTLLMLGFQILGGQFSIPNTVISMKVGMVRPFAPPLHLSLPHPECIT